MQIYAVIPQRLDILASPAFAGLTIDTDTIYVDATNHRLGINNTSPERELDLSSFTRSGTWGTFGGNDGGHSWWANNFYLDGSNLKVLNSHATIGYAGIVSYFEGSGSSLRFYAANPGSITKDAVITPTMRMIIDMLGNVGIGTIAPSARLDVVGNINATGFNAICNENQVVCNENKIVTNS